MRFSRQFRLLTVLLSLWVLLLAQSAIAGHVCPAQLSQGAQTVQPHCAEMAQDHVDQPALCLAHCHPTQASADHFALPVLATLAQLGAVLSLQPVADAQALLRPAVPPPPRGPGQPLILQNCCLRI